MPSPAKPVRHSVPIRKPSQLIVATSSFNNNKGEKKKHTKAVFALFSSFTVLSPWFFYDQSIQYYSKYIIHLSFSIIHPSLNSPSYTLNTAMDILLSIPVLTYLFSPTQPSWSTSLNILFFYMTWTTLILSHAPLKVHLVGILAIRAVFWLLLSLLTLLFDVTLPSVSESIKHGGRAGLPPRNAHRLGRIGALALFNSVLLIAAEGAASYTFMTLCGRPEFRTSTTLPFPWQIVKHVVILLVSREALQYYIHRFILHGPNPIGQLHQSYAHHKPGAPFSLQLFTDHPLPLLLHRFVPLYIPGLFLRPHLLTYFLFIALVTLEETFAMSGYTIVPGIMMSGICQRTAIHYAGKGSANYGAYGVVDWAHSTSRGRDVLDDIRSEADKHHVEEQAAKKVDQGYGMFQRGIGALRNKSSISATDSSNSTSKKRGKK